MLLNKGKLGAHSLSDTLFITNDEFDASQGRYIAYCKRMGGKVAEIKLNKHPWRPPGGQGNFNRMICSFSVNTVDLAPNAMNNQLCQADLGDRRVVSPKAGSEMAAALGLQYFESSAKDQTGVEVRSPRH